ncbi:hypothetical protein Y032_0067g119 [Ancylostoma ceylanicum]|nr:hypothetical protein Y032_0067g119 [Ancylostoma ceylanicum]
MPLIHPANTDRKCCLDGLVVRADVRRCGDQGFGSRPVARFCEYYAVFPHVRCSYPTNTNEKSSPDGSVAERRIGIRPYRWFHSVGDLKVKRRFCSAVAAMQCSRFTARHRPGSPSGSPGRLPATFYINF